MGSLTFRLTEHFTEPASESLRLAHNEARELRHSFVGTEHMLLALLREGDGSAATVLTSFGVTYPYVRAAVIRMMGLGVDQTAGELALTGRAQDAIDRAGRDASMRDEPIGTEHMLLALVREPNGAAARILLQLDVDPVAVRAALAQ